MAITGFDQGVFWLRKTSEKSLLNERQPRLFHQKLKLFDDAWPMKKLRRPNNHLFEPEEHPSRKPTRSSSRSADQCKLKTCWHDMITGAPAKKSLYLSIGASWIPIGFLLDPFSFPAMAMCLSGTGWFGQPWIEAASMDEAPQHWECGKNMGKTPETTHHLGIVYPYHLSKCWWLGMKLFYPHYIHIIGNWRWTSTVFSWGTWWT